MSDSYITQDNSGNSENSDNTVIFLPPYNHSGQSQLHVDLIIYLTISKCYTVIYFYLKMSSTSLFIFCADTVGMRNPVLERLTGQTQSQGGGLRNESYYRVSYTNPTCLRSS